MTADLSKGFGNSAERCNAVPNNLKGSVYVQNGATIAYLMIATS